MVTWLITLRERQEIILKIFEDFDDLRAKRRRAYRGMLCATRMKVRWRLRLRRHGKHGLANGTFLDTRHRTEVRYTLINFGLWAGMPLGLPYYVPGKSSDRPRRPRLGGEEPKRRTELIFYSAMERLALRSVLKPFAEDFISSTRRVGKFRARYLMLVRMQRGIRQKLETKDAKTAVLT